MATLDDVRAIALGLPETLESIDGHRGGVKWQVGTGAFVWERRPSKADLAALARLERTWPDGVVIAIRTDGALGKEALLGTFPEIFFTIPHFDGFPAVLFRLELIDVELLREVVTDAWLLKAPPALANEWLAAHGDA